MLSFPQSREPEDIPFIQLKPKPGSDPRVSPGARDAVKSGPVMSTATFSLFTTVLSLLRCPEKHKLYEQVIDSAFSMALSLIEIIARDLVE